MYTLESQFWFKTFFLSNLQSVMGLEVIQRAGFKIVNKF